MPFHFTHPEYLLVVCNIPMGNSITSEKVKLVHMACHKNEASYTAHTHTQLQIDNLWYALIGSKTFVG